MVFNIDLCGNYDNIDAFSCNEDSVGSIVKADRNGEAKSPIKRAKRHEFEA